MSQREQRILAVGALLLAAAMLFIAVFAQPPYPYFEVLKFVVLGAGATGANALWGISPWLSLLAIPIVVLAGVEFFAKMHRHQWVFWNWLTALLFIGAALTCGFNLRQTATREGK